MEPSNEDITAMQCIGKVPVTWGLLYRLYRQRKGMGMTRLSHLTSAAILGIALIGGTATAFAYTGQQFAKEAKVSLKEARTIALKAVPGQITDEELEKEGGGSGLRYSFDVKDHGATHEVGVDAKTGAVLENSIEGPHSD